MYRDSHLDDLLHGLVDLEPAVEPGRAGGEDAPVGGELAPVHLQDDVTEAALFALQAQLLKNADAMRLRLGDGPGCGLKELVRKAVVAKGGRHNRDRRDRQPVP
jgi:hypothetical protein